MRIIIVGGGVMGLSCAFFLTRQGLKNIKILEASAAIGNGSSGRNPGAIRSGFSSPINRQMTLHSKRIMAEFEALTKHPLDFRQNGYLWLANSKDQALKLQKIVKILQKSGVASDWLNPSETQSLVPALASDRFIGASFTSSDGVVNPHQMVAGFAYGSLSAGVSIECNYPVTKILMSNGRIRGVEGPSGEIEADVIINAAGPHAAALLTPIGINLPVKSYRRHSFISGPAFWVKEPMPFMFDSETGAYFRHTADGLIFGRGKEYKDDPPTFSTNVKSDALSRAVKAASQVIPAMSNTSVMHGYAGLYAMTPDLHAILGPVEQLKGLYLACGFSGHGLMHAPITGLLLAEWIAQGETQIMDAHSLRLERFEEGNTIAEDFQF